MVMLQNNQDIRWSYILQNKNTLMGIFALMIVLYHFCLDCLQFSDFPLLFVIYGKYGNAVSDGFLFLSGAGLYYSLSKNHNVKEFYKKRFLRVYLPFVFAASIFFIWANIFYNSGITGFFKDVLLLTVFTKYGQQFWFVATILICYLMYPVIFMLIQKSNKLVHLFMCVAAVVVGTVLLQNEQAGFENYEICLTRIPVFMIGCYFGKLSYENKKPKINIGIYIAIQAVVIVVWKIGQVLLERKLQINTLLLKRYWLGIVGMELTLVCALVLYKYSGNCVRFSFFNFIGSISLELYIAHIELRYIYWNYFSKISIKSTIAGYICIVVISILWSVICSKIVKKICT